MLNSIDRHHTTHRLPIMPPLFLSWLVLFHVLGQAQVVPPANLLLLHGRIYTSNPAKPWAEAVAIAGDKILAVGSDQELAPYRTSKTMVIDLAGRMALPGLIDSHTHFVAGSESLAWVNLEEATTSQEVKERIRAYSLAHPKLAWVRGSGWLYGIFPPTGLPTKQLLDEAVPDRPAAIVSYDMHSLWVNTRAMALAHITRETPDVVVNGIVVGTIVRDSTTGEATGPFKEAAMVLIERVMPDPPREDELATLRSGMSVANRLGLTAIVNATGDLHEMELYDELNKRGELTLRTTTAFAREAVPHRLTPDELQNFEDARKRFHDDWVRAGLIKFFADGVVESHSASMLEPYADDHHLRGSTSYTPDEFQRFVIELDRRGFQIMTHAIGDRAVRMTLDAYEAAEKQNGARDRRFRIEHIETINPSDIPRFGQLGVIASVMPYHLCLGGCPNEGGVWANDLGLARLRWAFAWHDLLASGTHLAFGSDWPVASQNPFLGIQTAITRQDLQGKPPGGWNSQQKLTLDQALAGYTREAAFAAFFDDRIGSLESGKLADLIVLSQNLFEVPALKIGETKVQLTIVGGRIVWRDGI
jgi:predicted amidohydrolase YtcJ